LGNAGGGGFGSDLPYSRLAAGRLEVLQRIGTPILKTKLEGGLASSLIFRGTGGARRRRPVAGDCRPAIQIAVVEIAFVH
jgi:hypothetical protein